MAPGKHAISPQRHLTHSWARRGHSKCAVSVHIGDAAFDMACWRGPAVTANRSWLLPAMIPPLPRTTSVEMAVAAVRKHMATVAVLFVVSLGGLFGSASSLLFAMCREDQGIAGYEVRHRCVRTGHLPPTGTLRTHTSNAHSQNRKSSTSQPLRRESHQLRAQVCNGTGVVILVIFMFFLAAIVCIVRGMSQSFSAYKARALAYAPLS